MAKSLKEYSVTDFEKITDFSSSITFCNGLESGLDLIKTEFSLDKNVKKVFWTGKNLCLASHEDLIYRLTEYGFELLTIAPFSNLKEVFLYQLGGQDILCVYANGFIYFLDSGIDAIPCKDFKKILSLDGRIYGYTDNCIYFNKLCTDNISTYRSLFNLSISIADEYGKILDVLRDGKDLIIISTNAILRLVTAFNEEDFCLKKVQSIYGELEESSIQKVKDKVVYLSKDRVVTIGEKTFNSRLLKDAIVVDKAKHGGHLYVLPVSISGENYFYVLDTLSLSEQFVKSTNLLTDGLYAVNELNGRVYLLGEVSETSSSNWQSVPMDFGVQSQKVLIGIKVSGSPLKVTVKANNQSFSFISNGRKKILPVGIKSDLFTVNISGDKNRVSVTEITFYYNE